MNGYSGALLLVFHGLPSQSPTVASVIHYISPVVFSSLLTWFQPGVNTWRAGDPHLTSTMFLKLTKDSFPNEATHRDIHTHPILHCVLWNVTPYPECWNTWCISIQNEISNINTYLCKINRNSVTFHQGSFKCKIAAGVDPHWFNSGFIMYRTVYDEWNWSCNINFGAV